MNVRTAGTLLAVATLTLLAVWATFPPSPHDEPEWTIYATDADGFRYRAGPTAEDQPLTLQDFGRDSHHFTYGATSSTPVVVLVRLPESSVSTQVAKQAIPAPEEGWIIVAFNGQSNLRGCVLIAGYELPNESPQPDHVLVDPCDWGRWDARTGQQLAGPGQGDLQQFELAVASGGQLQILA